MSFAHRPDSPSLSLPEVVALNSQNNPQDPLYVYAKPEPSTEVVTITHLEFARATHRAAQILRPNPGSSDGEVVAIIALSDNLLYQAVVVGLVTAHLIPFPISPRNSPAAVVKLLRKTSCHRLVATCVTLAPLIAGILQELRQEDPDFILKVEEIPSLAQVYPNLGTETAASRFESYPIPATKPGLDDVAMYLHSSGSTGFPKAIPQTHRILIQWASLGTPFHLEGTFLDSHHFIAAITDLRDHIPQPVASMACPAFHLAGTFCQLLQPIYGGVVVALYPPTATAPNELPVMPSPDNIITYGRKTNCKSMMIFPTFLILWSKSRDAMAYLKTLDFVGCSGGPVPPRVGNALASAGVKLRALYAGTEFGALSTLVPKPGDEAEWEWVQFSDKIKLRWMPQGDGTHECQILNWDHHTVCVENLDDVRGYGTSDLWVNHPEKKHLWKIVGRIDDVIVHSSAEKTVPAPVEGIVMSSPLVAGTVMFGRDRDQAGILIEPAPDIRIDVTGATQVAELRNKLWPIIEEANAIAPAFSRIFKEMILFTSPDKPLPRAGKGTVLRKASLDVYSNEIDALYDVVAEKTNIVDAIKPPSVWELATIQPWLLELAIDLSDSPEISPEVDLFQQGFDSLNATFLRLRILDALRSTKAAEVQKAAAGVTQNLVYSYPTVLQLSSFLADLISGTLNVYTVDPKTAIEAMIEKYTMHWIPRVPVTSKVNGESAVLLTGSTGSLGSQILESLLRDARVKKVYALNRPSRQARSLLESQLAVFEDKGLDACLLSSPKLLLIEGQTDEKDLGLAVEMFNEIRDAVTVIIHNAWMVDFNMALSSFEPHIRGTRNLVDFASTCPLAPRFVFTSSISSALGWDRTRGPCPEELTELGGDIGGSTGYGQSKFVAEQIIGKSGMTASILRIGQVCGAPPNGAWATNDWFPILVKTSLNLGFLPLADGVVSWIDFKMVSEAVLDVSLSALGPEFLVFNAVHPRPVSWNHVINAIQSEIQKTSSSVPELVPFPEWCAHLDAAAAEAAVNTKEKLPGIKLLHFFRHLANGFGGSTSPSGSEFGLCGFSTEKMRTISCAIGDARRIGDEHVKAWVEYWSSIGFI
ncbi:General substrate transporter [Mycena venus]|uniref:General substrate transporter n=1 Tax=Mycena venus TaxID=2733690 RepID=A0A8H6YPT0_9AGAR|nr:General substrate transporter [Mycena venus]